MASKGKKIGRPVGRTTETAGFSLPSALVGRLRDYAKWTGQSISAVVAKAVTRYLDEPEPKEKNSEK